MPVQRILRDTCRISVQGFALAVLLFFLLELLFGRTVLLSREALHDGRGSSSDFAASGSLSHIQHMLAGAGRLAVAQSRAILTGSSADTTATAYLDAGDICPSCNASVRGDFANSKSFVTVPLLERHDARAVFLEPGQTARRATLKRFLIHHIPLAASISGAWLSASAQNVMLNSYFAAPDALLSYNFDGLSLDLPTAYIYTRTGGKKLDSERRLAFFGMHHDTIRAFRDKVEREGYHDGAQAQDRQLLYIIVRDESQIDPELDAFFREAGIRALSARDVPARRHRLIYRVHVSVPLLRNRPYERPWDRSVECSRTGDRGGPRHLLRVSQPGDSSEIGLLTLSLLDLRPAETGRSSTSTMTQGCCLVFWTASGASRGSLPGRSGTCIRRAVRLPNSAGLPRLR